MRIITSTNALTNWYQLEIQKRIPGTVCWRHNVGGGYPIATIAKVNGALMDRDYATAVMILRRSRPVMFGGLAGLPDICGILPDGRWLGVELKGEKDGQRDAQKVCERVFKERGAVYVVVRDEAGIEDVVRAVAGE